MYLQHPCDNNHAKPPPECVTPLPHGNKIGHEAGWRLYGRFIDQKGFGADQSLLDYIEGVNGDYQQTQYLPRMEAARAIYTWLDFDHVIAEPDDPETICPVCGIQHDAMQFEDMRVEKDALLCALDSGIDGEWRLREAQLRILIPNDSYNAFLAWAALQGD